MRQQRVLILDDDKEFADGMALRCRALGLAVETARNSLTAMGIVAMRPPDLICLDVEMPTGNGLSICEFLHADPAMTQKPIVVLTGRKDAGTIRRCGELHARYVFKSPQVWRDLRDAIVEMLDLDRDVVSAVENAPELPVEVAVASA